MGSWAFTQSSRLIQASRHRRQRTESSCAFESASVLCLSEPAFSAAQDAYDFVAFLFTRAAFYSGWPQH
jgi:hypothetical protein